MNENIMCPNCNRMIKANNKFCPYCGGKVEGVQQPVQSSINTDSSSNITLYQLAPNTMLNRRYHIERVMGEGDNDISYLAEDITLQIKVVVDEFYPKDFVNREADGKRVIVVDQNLNDQVQMRKHVYQEEARNRAKLSSLPGIAEVRDYFEENGTAYTVMEWLNGGSLQDFIERNGYCNPSDAQNGMGKRISMDVVKQMMEPIILSLIKSHEIGMIHGDISPEHMAFSSKGTLKLLHAMSGTAMGESSDKTVMINMGYAPIERYHTSESQGPWSDVYSLCATMYKCITGVQPMDASERAYQDTLKSPSEMGIQIDPYDESALMMGLAVQVEKRFVDMKVLHKALYREPKNQPSPQPLPFSQGENLKTKKEVAPKKKSNMGLIIGIGVAVVMLLAVVLVGALVLPDIISSYDKDNNDVVNKTEHEENLEQEKEKESDKEELGEEELAKLKELEEQAKQDTSFTNQKNVLEQYYSFAVEYNAAEEMSEQVEDCFDTYKAGVLEHVKMLESQEVIPAMYIQMKTELDEVMELSSRMEELDIELDYADVEEKANTLKTDYRQRLIDNFDNKAIENINNNGVISRSVLWAAMENADQTGLFDDTNLEDELRLRYVTALTYHIDSELTGVDTAGDISKIYEALESTDYSPLLLYYLSYNYADDKAKGWYMEVNSILASNIGDFDAMSINEKKNFIYYLNSNSGSYATAREQIREYMQKNFEKP